MYHFGTEGDGGLAEAVWDSDHSPAVDWSVLDCGLRHSRRSWFRSVFGECQGDEELTRAQKRCAGESMADETAHLWSVAELVSALSGNPHDADLLAKKKKDRWCAGGGRGTILLIQR